MTRVNEAALLLEQPQGLNENFDVSLRKMISAASELGTEIIFGKRERIRNTITFSKSLDPAIPLVAYGSIQFIRNLSVPHFAYGWSGTDWANVASRIPRNWLLNDDYVMTSWGDLESNFDWWSDKLDSTGLFIRPNSDKKVFAGQPIPRDDASIALPAIRNLTSVMPETICVASSIKYDFTEYRFFIVNRKIVGMSPYSSQNTNPVVPAVAIDFVNLLCQLDWQPDSCYVIDVAVLADNTARLIEYNSMCCSGVYDCEVGPIIQAVLDQSIRDSYL